jgi:hypothetical protein
LSVGRLVKLSRYVASIRSGGGAEKSVPPAVGRSSFEVRHAAGARFR